MKKPKSFKLSDAIHRYNSIKKENPSSGELKPLYEKIEHEVLLITYFLPQTRLGLEEEDASEFMFFMKDKLPSILSSFSDNYDNFLAYYTSALRLRLRNFKMRRARMEHFDTSVFRGHHIYEYLLNEETAPEVAEDKPVYQNEKLRKLKCILWHSPTSRKRLFIFLASVTPYMSVDEIENICTALAYNLKSTLIITEKLSKICEKSNLELMRIKERRNFYFEFLLNLEFQLDANPERQNLIEKITENRSKFNSKIEQLEEYQRKIPSVKIGQVFNMNRKTVGSCLFFSRNIISFCSDSNSEFENDFTRLGLSEPVLKKIKSENRQITRKLPVLDPLELFSVNL